MKEMLRNAALTMVAGAVVGGLMGALLPSRSEAQTSSEVNPPSGGQEEPNGSAELRQNRRRLQINRRGMSVLLGWAGANMGVGAYGWATADSARARYFNQMNLAWNGVNAAIGALGLIQASREDPKGLNPVETIEKTHSMQQLLLLNAGLDVAYMAGGMWLRERGDNRGDAQLAGYGDSLLLQGGFLFVFDLAMWGIHQHALTDYKMQLAPRWKDGPGAVLSVEF